MKGWAAAALLGAMMAARAQTAPPAAPPFPATSETVETGEIRLGIADQPPVPWRIRLLPIASFPDLPPAVAAQLGLRQCMIPQSFEARGPENVIHGSFRAPGSDDWAALCSVRGSTTLYVFFGGQFDAPISLRTQRDTEWLGAEPGSRVLGSAWGIWLSRQSELQESPEVRRAIHPDHDGIQDAQLERFSTIRYYQDGKWLALAGGS